MRRGHGVCGGEGRQGRCGRRRARLPCARQRLRRPGGGMAERLKAHAWKACSPKGVEGSNPSPSSTLRLRFRVAGHPKALRRKSVPRSLGEGGPAPACAKPELRPAGQSPPPCAKPASAGEGRSGDGLFGEGRSADGHLFGSKRHYRAGREGRPRGTGEPGSAARPALRASLTRVTRSGSRQLRYTPMAIRAAKALTSQTTTGTFFNLSMKTSCYNRGRRSHGADACQHFMNRRARTAQSHSNPRQPAEG